MYFELKIKFHERDHTFFVRHTNTNLRITYFNININVIREEFLNGGQKVHFVYNWRESWRKSSVDSFSLQ